MPACVYMYESVCRGKVCLKLCADLYLHLDVKHLFSAFLSIKETPRIVPYTLFILEDKFVF